MRKHIQVHIFNFFFPLSMQTYIWSCQLINFWKAQPSFTHDIQIHICHCSPFLQVIKCLYKNIFQNINNAIATFQKRTCLYNHTGCSIYDVQQRLMHHVPNGTPSTITKYTNTIQCNVTSSATMGTPCANGTSCTQKRHIKCQQYTKYSTKLSHIYNQYFEVNNPKTYSFILNFKWIHCYLL